MLNGLLLSWIGLRARFRGLALPIFALPLVPTALVGLVANEPRTVTGALIGIAASLLAARRLWRGRRGDTRQAAVLMGLGTGAAAALAAKLHMPLPVLLGLGGYFGTRLMYTALPEAAPPPPPEPPPPPPPELPEPIRDAQARLARIQAAGDPRLAPPATAIAGLLADLTERPDRLPLARRFLNVQVDGLERIAARLAAGAEPPASLATLLADIQQAATDLRSSLKREETEALEVQVKVLSDRLREEGYR